jgi:hypothetical protein
MKIYKTGNYLVVEGNHGKTYKAPLKDVDIKSATANGETYYTLINFRGFYENPVKLSEAKKADNSAYTQQELEDFFFNETGVADMEVLPDEDFQNLPNKENKLYFTY